jgi:hypothetical protein
MPADSSASKASQFVIRSRCRNDSTREDAAERVIMVVLPGEDWEHFAR